LDASHILTFELQHELGETGDMKNCVSSTDPHSRNAARDARRRKPAAISSAFPEFPSDIRPKLKLIGRPRRHGDQNVAETASSPRATRHYARRLAAGESLRETDGPPSVL